MKLVDWKYIKWGDWKELPNREGCYAFITKSGMVLYIGRSKMLSMRLSSLYKHTMGKAIPEGLRDYIRIHWAVEAYESEKDLILEYMPIFNIDYALKPPGRVVSVA